MSNRKALQDARHSPWLQAYRIGPHRPTKKPQHFSWRLARGLKRERVSLKTSTTIEDSETIAHSFLDEEVVGFDMEWYYNPDATDRNVNSNERPIPYITEIHDRISVIQVASLSRVALFHVGKHEGETPEELLAPSLRAIIESPNIRKVGQSIMGDYRRLQEYFRLSPQAFFELSYFHNLITPDRDNKTLYLTGGLKALVSAHFCGFKLEKDHRMHMDWTKDLTEMQKDYAANDAYASLMLYWCMDDKRRLMKPVLPRPRNTEEYMPSTSRLCLPKNPIQLEKLSSTATEHLTVQQYKWLFRDTGQEEEPSIPPTADGELYDDLLACRERLAAGYGVEAHVIVSKSALAGVAMERPTTLPELLNVAGMEGPKHKFMFGVHWLAITNKYRRLEKENGDPSTTSKKRKVMDVKNGASKRPPLAEKLM
jgi:ribonuclease D